MRTPDLRSSTAPFTTIRTDRDNGIAGRSAIKPGRDNEIAWRTDEGVLPRLGYSVPEASQITSLSKSKLWELIRSGALRSVKVAGRRIVTHAALTELLNGEGA
jgi:excisionase family DNA binding protein